MTNAQMIDAMEKLLNEICEDYQKWSNFSENKTDQAREIRAKMIREFIDNIYYTVGAKYIRVITGNSVWGFVVNTTEDKKFQYGDILKAAGWKAPARNKPRGNVFEDYEIQWTGPNYL